MFSHLLLLVVGIAITGATTIIFTLDCKSPMDHGNGTGNALILSYPPVTGYLLEAVERFFYDPEPNCCFAFKYTGSGGKPFHCAKAA